MVVFSVYLVFKEELNLMLKVLRLLFKVRWAKIGGTDSFSQVLRLANFMDLQRPKLINDLSSVLPKKQQLVL